MSDEPEDYVPTETVLEAMHGDRRWFMNHPGARCRYRDLVEGERQDLIERGSKLTEIVEEIAGILNCEEWTVRMVVCAMKLGPGVIISLPALEVSNRSVRRNVLLWMGQEGHFIESSVDEILKQARVKLKKTIQRASYEMRCKDCGGIPPTGSLTVKLGRKLICPGCAMTRALRGQKFKREDVAYVSSPDQTTITIEQQKQAEEFVEELERIAQ